MYTNKILILFISTAFLLFSAFAHSLLRSDWHFVSVLSSLSWIALHFRLRSLRRLCAIQAWESTCCGFDSLCLCIKKNLTVLFLLVKVMGIEPMSESISTRASPSAADDLKFRFPHRPTAGYAFRYSVYYSALPEYHTEFPAFIMPATPICRWIGTDKRQLKLPVLRSFCR